MNGEKTPYLIHCPKSKDGSSCGQSTFLTKEQYMNQMMNPNKGWQCPQCGIYPCDWDDKNYDDYIESMQKK